MSTYKAVLFDLDGTLARTMEDTFNAWRTTFLEYGIEIKPEDYYPLEGLRLDKLVKEISEVYNIQPPDEREVITKKEQYFLADNNFTLYPGVEELIIMLHSRNIPIAMVTSGLANRLKGTVPLEFIEQFDCIITGDGTGEGKPSPVPYLRAAEQLEVNPGDCIVVENAPAGIESAKNAGAYCIAICSTLKESYLKKADEILDSFEYLKYSMVIRKLLE